MQETEALWPAKKVDVAIPLGLSYEYMNVILDARYNVSLTKAGKRSEEHTSELQSHVRISYAVFCLKKVQETFIHFFRYSPQS